MEGKCRGDVRKQIVGRLHEVASEAKAAGFSAADVKEVMNTCFKGEESLYGEVPSGLLGLGKWKR